MTPAEAGTSAPEALVPAAPAPERQGSLPAACVHPGIGSSESTPVRSAAPVPVSPGSGRVVLDRTEAHELCDVLWRAERALCARGWQCLGQATGAWVAVLEERLWEPATR